MKKIIIPAISLAALLLTGACSIDERTSGNNGNEAMLTLNMGLDGAVQTRAIGDGSGANHLIYAVFDMTGERINQVSKDVNFPTTETITLAKGQTYMIAFWAQNKDCAAYKVSEDMVVTINYKEAKGNDETRDAFFKTVKVTVTGDAELDVELTRPFAQINVGVTTEDWNAAVAAGITITESKAVVKQAASTLNLLDGTVGTPVDVTFDFGKIPNENEKLSVDLDGEGPEDYKYLSMNYILPNDATTGDASTTLEDLEFTFRPVAGNDITLTQGLDAVPVQRNWRTNIVGRILSGNLDINISIDPGFNGDNNNKIWDGNTTNEPESTETEWIVSSAAEWAYLKQYGTQGKNIKLDADINFFGNEVKGIGFSGTFDGQGYKMFNMTLLPGGSDYSNGLFQGDASSGDITVKNLTIENVTAASSNPEHGYVGAIFGDVQNGNLTLENVHVKNVDLRGVQSVGGLVGFVASGKTVKINNCSVDGSKLSNYAVENESGYVAGLVGRPVGTVNVTNSTVTNTTIDAYYAARRGEESIQPVVGGYTELTAGTDVVVKKTSLENAVFVDTPEELAAALSAGNSTIYLTKGEYVIPATANGKTVTFIGAGKPEDVKVAVTKVGEGGENCDFGLDGSKATFEGITITTNSSTYIGYARCNGTYKNCIINGTYTLYGESIFENCVFNVSGNVYNIWTWGAEEIKFTGCTFNSDGKALLLYREAGGTVNLTVKDCTFNDKGGLVDAMKAAIEIGDSPFENKPTYNVTVSNTTVNGYAVNDEGESTGTNIWGNKNSMPDDRLNVTIDGTVVY